MRGRTKKLVIGAAGLGLAAGLVGGGVAIAGGADDSPSVTGPEAEAATSAALAATGGGRSNSVERDAENGAVWEVEVTKPDGTTVDVRLDGSYKVVVVEGDSETADAGDSAGAQG